MSTAPATTIDAYDEFQPPRPPIEGGGTDPRRFRRPEITPYEEGQRYGRNRVEMSVPTLQMHVARWQTSLLNKFSIINGEVKELEARRKSPGLILTLMFGILFGAAGFLIAIAVDYYIVRDFWNAVYANEYGEVPASAGISPLVKALQVVVAALMFHFLYQALGRSGKRAFVYIMAVLTLILLIGVGVWVANDNLPPNFKMFGVQITEEAEVRDTTLSDLGLAPAEQEPAADPAADARNEEGKAMMSNALGIIWFLAFGMIFVVVTGVAALSLGVASRAAGGLFGPIDRENYDGRAMNRQDVKYRLERAKQAQINLRNPHYRKKLLRAFLVEFLEGYVDGAGRNSKSRELVDSFHAAAPHAFDEVDMTYWDEETVGDESRPSPQGKGNGEYREADEAEKPLPSPDDLRPEAGNGRGERAR